MTRTYALQLAFSKILISLFARDKVSDRATHGQKSLGLQGQLIYTDTFGLEIIGSNRIHQMTPNRVINDIVDKR